MNHEHNHSPTPLLPAHPTLRDYVPLMTIIAVILAATIAVMTSIGFTLDNFLGFSMGFFFLIFAMFKLLDLSGFAHGYHEYDLIAKRIFAWGWIYPFIEATLGLLYLARVDSPWLHGVTIALAALTCLSVGIKLAKREVIQCACLGTVLKVPITYVSLVEYAAMGVMAAAMLAI